MARKPKKIGEWEFSVEGQTFKVPYRLYADDHSGGKSYFSCEIQYGEHVFRGDDPSLDVLRSQAKKWLENVVTFTWEEFYQITIGAYIEIGGRGHDRRIHDDDDEETRDAVNVKLIYEVDRFEIGTDSNGDKVYRDPTRRVNNGKVMRGEPKTGDEDRDIFHDYMPVRRALVRVTPESAAALKRIAEGFQELYGKLHALLDPVKIEQTLSQVAGLLPAPEPAKAAKKRRR